VSAGGTGQTVPVLRRIDLLALGAAVLTFAVVLLYLVLVAQENGRPTLWAVAVLTVCGAGALYGAWKDSRLRRTVLWPCTLALFLMGYLTLFTIGLPLILSAGFCASSALRPRNRDWRDMV
jgi:hypothetical protein